MTLTLGYSLIVAFEISALVQFILDMIFVLSDPAYSCDRSIGAPLSGSYLTVKLFQRIVVNLLPVWIMLYCLRPKQRVRMLIRLCGDSLI